MPGPHWDDNVEDVQYLDLNSTHEWYSNGFTTGYLKGYAEGYRLAVEESYPELKESE